MSGQLDQGDSYQAQMTCLNYDGRSVCPHARHAWRPQAPFQERNSENWY